MSSLTREQIGIIARGRTGAPVSERPGYEKLVDDALKALARKVARRDDYKELRKEINVTVASGVITISDASVILETVAETGVLVLNGAVSQPKERYGQLELSQPKDTHYHALRNRKIYVREITTGGLGSCAHTGTLEANYTPTLSELPSVFDEELIDEVVALAAGGAQ